MQKQLSVQLQRLNSMFSILPMYGSLWRVPEYIWITQYGNENIGYDLYSTRMSHPGCLVSNQVINGMLSMLEGFSKKKRKFAIGVEGVFNSKRKTYFGNIPPVQIPLKFWEVANCYENGITQNVHHNMLNKEEITKVKDLMEKFPWKKK